MLVLSRKVGESIQIGENIEVTVVEVKQGRVRLGFRCPAQVSILRQEIYDREHTSERQSQTVEFELTQA